MAIPTEVEDRLLVLERLSEVCLKFVGSRNTYWIICSMSESVGGELVRERGKKKGSISIPYSASGKEVSGWVCIA